MLTTMSAAKRSKSDVRQFQESWTTDFGFVCRNERAVCSYVHSAVKMLFAVPQVLNVILKPNIKNHSKMILRRMKLLKRQFLLTKNKLGFLKKPFAVQIKLRKVVTKLRNVLPSVGSLLPMVITLRKYLSIVPKFSLRICQIKKSFSQGLKICQCLLEWLNDVLKTWLLT